MLRSRSLWLALRIDSWRSDRSGSSGSTLEGRVVGDRSSACVQPARLSSGSGVLARVATGAHDASYATLTAGLLRSAATREGQCDTLDLALDDIVVHELNVEKLAEALCNLLDLESELQALPLAGQSWQIGWYVPVAGQRFATALILPVSGDQVHHGAVRLRDYYDRPFLLLVPTRTRDRAGDRRVPARRQVTLLFLEEVLGVGLPATGSFFARPRICCATFVMTS